jgi:hypothetical protein
MKYNKIIILFLAIYFSIQPVKAQVSNQDIIIHKLFATLKAKDEKAFVALYPNPTQLGKVVRVMMEQVLKSEQMQMMMSADEKSKNLNIDSLINTEVAKVNKPEAVTEMEKRFGKSFQKTIEAGQNKGVNWNEAKLISYTTDTVAGANPEMEMFKASGIKNLKGIIDFNVGDSAYQMSFDKIIYIPAEDGWFGGEFGQIIRKGEMFLKEGEAHIEGADSDSTVTTTSVPEGKKAKTKIKTTPAGKIKVKTKTPATKTKTKTKS